MKKQKASMSKDEDADVKEAASGATIGGIGQAQDDPSQVMNTLVGIIQQQQKQLEALQKIVLQKTAGGSAKVKENDSQGKKKKRPLLEQSRPASGGNAVKENDFQGNKKKKPLPEKSHQDFVAKAQKFHGVKCRTCQKYGHIAKDCLKTTGGCFTCFQLGHRSIDCPMRKAKQETSDKVQQAQPMVRAPSKDQPKGNKLRSKIDVSSQSLQEVMTSEAVLSASISANNRSIVHQRDSNSDIENADVETDEASAEEEFEEEVNEEESMEKEDKLIEVVNNEEEPNEEQETGKEEEESNEEEPFEEEISEEDPSEEEDPDEEETKEEETKDLELFEKSDQEPSDEDSSERGDPVPITTVPLTGKIYVGHIPHSVNDDMLNQLFLPFGPIREAVVIRDKYTGLSKGYGFIRYDDATSATQAVAKMNGYGVDGHILAVYPSTGNSVPRALSSCTTNPPKERVETKIYVGYLPLSVNDDMLKQLFMPFGPIRDAIVIRDKYTGLSKGYGFIRYGDATSAIQAVSQMNGYRIEGRILAVRVASPSSDANHCSTAYPMTASTPASSSSTIQVDSLTKLLSFNVPLKDNPAPDGLTSNNANQGIDEAKLFVGNLPQSLNNDHLKQLFMPFGQIREAIVLQDKKTGLSKGYGFVRFVDSRFATQALARMNGAWIQGKMLVVKVAGHPSSTTSTNMQSLVRHQPL